MPAVVVGRDAELASIRDFVTGISDGASALVLEGEAGMGKTTLWRAGVEAAEVAGVCVLQAEPAESETALSFSGLGDLLDPVLDDALAPLAARQRSALARALVLEEVEGPAPDAHAAGVALLNALRGLASNRDLLVAVDDVQWLDAATSAALAYAVRRLRAEHVGVLLARRAGLESPLPDELRRGAGAGRYGDIDVGPLDLAAMHQVVHAHLAVALPRPLLAEVHQASGGNPFYALEIVRTLSRSGVSVEAGRPLPVPDSLHDLVHARLLALPPESRHFLLAAAAHAHPTIAITEAASGVAPGDGLAPALEARVVELDGERIRFTHPLLAAGVYEAGAPLRRVEVHRRLAELLEDPEARAWQLAAAADRPDESVASALEEAAWHARARGAPRPAALLLDRAHELTPLDRGDDAVRRTVDAAYLHYESGDSPRAEEQLRNVVSELPPGPIRARALVRLGRVRMYEALGEGAEFFSRAVEDAAGDSELLAVAHEGFATCLWQLYERLATAAEHADHAIELAREIGDEALAGEALNTLAMAELLLGRESATETMAHAATLQAAGEQRRVLSQPRWFPEYTAWTGALRESRDELEEMLRRAAELGDESSPPYLIACLGRVECELGWLASALERTLAAQEAAEQAGQKAILAFGLALESFVHSRMGSDDLTRQAAARSLDLVGETGDRQSELTAIGAIGHLDLVRGDPEAAVRRFEPLLAFVRAESIEEPGAVPFVVDHIEALIEVARRDEAVQLLDWYEGNANRLGRSSIVASCLRCRGLVAAHDGDLDAAADAFARALDMDPLTQPPLDRGRTLLALGATQRRAKRRREARETLEEALGVFEGIGAALWAERARAELARISGRAATPGALTPAEERVAALVAEGKTNREVAAALFLSDRTVEGHLTHVFSKLGVRSRSELARSLAVAANADLEPRARQ
jgi:DNA-binding CsgD family transcriptional regulator